MCTALLRALLLSSAGLSLAAGCTGGSGQDTCPAGETRACYDGPEGTLGVGLCRGGAQTCDGERFGDACEGQVLPVVELCNGVDDDCDGTVDEGCACVDGQTQPCFTADMAVRNVGACADGVQTCAGGAWGACEGEMLPSAEVCDGTDNNCDGEEDEGNPGGDVACSTGLHGVCASGTTACFAGALTCVQEVEAGPEVCDGQDNDCDGTVDEDNPGGGGSCNTGLLGVCEMGTLVCANGQLLCEQTVQPGAELCGNGLDDNCDGTIDENPDLDGDGFGVCDGDCCELPGQCGEVAPHLVNPGALDVTGNGVDDDCDGVVDMGQNFCSATASFSATHATLLAQSMELCQATSANPPPAQRRWGLISAELTDASGSGPNNQDLQRAVMFSFGSNVIPQVGQTMAALSTGAARAMNHPGFVSSMSTDFDAPGLPPSVFLGAHGGVLPSPPSCPTGSGANDGVNLRLQVRVPTNATSLTFRWKFHSADYPQWVCSQFSDFFLALLTSQAPGLPADRNIAFDVVGNYVSLNTATFEVCQGCALGTQELIGTGFPPNDAGATAWRVTTAPVVPGEIITLDLMVFDVQDGTGDSLVLLDGFEWGT